MNREKRGILYGMSIGDGCISKQSTNKNYGLTVGHSPRQEEYLTYKADLLLSTMGGKRPNINRYKSHNKSTGKEYTNLQFRKVDPYFNQIHKNLYATGLKVITRKCLDYLTDQGLALWFMDDGSGAICKNREGKSCGCMVRISTYCSGEEAEVIAKWFLDRYQLTCKFDVDNRSGKVSIRFGTLDSKKFAEIVSPYIIPSMKYKIEDILSYTPRALGTPSG
jgi:hypothetical protein